jgi:uncharacterized membrane protein YphA (DoxX/SURF4 family)
MDRFCDAIRAFARRTDVELDLVRVYLGLVLMVRGVLFLSHPDVALRFLEHDGYFSAATTAHYIGFAHVCGGLMLSLGLCTRLAAAVQMPVLLGVLLCPSLREGAFYSGQSPEMSTLILFLLGVFAFFGAGPWSADYRLHHPRISSLHIADNATA